VELTEWHLAGPTLVAFICALTQRMRLSRAQVREFLSDWLGLSLSTSTINQCIHEAARAVEPVVEEEIREAVRNIELLYADETSWKEHGRLLWLWVFACVTATLFIVGRRTREVVRQALGDAFRGWLMSDGYWAYRDLDQRLRCLAHLIRKARDLPKACCLTLDLSCRGHSPTTQGPVGTTASFTRNLTRRSRNQTGPSVSSIV
jgi:transposase